MTVVKKAGMKRFGDTGPLPGGDLRVSFQLDFRIEYNFFQENGIVTQIPRIDSETQTDQEPNAEAESEPRTWIPGIQIHEDAATILLGRTIKDEPDFGDLNGEEKEGQEEEDGESNLTQTLNKIQQQFLEELEEEPKIQVWSCEICSAIFKKISLIRQHMSIAHELQVRHQFFSS